MTAAKRTADMTIEAAPEPKDAGMSRIRLIVPSSAADCAVAVSDVDVMSSPMRAWLP